MAPVAPAMPLVTAPASKEQPSYEASGPPAIGPIRPVRVLYVGGTGRTGSTLLDKLLGQYPGFFSAGELAFMWRFALREGSRCSCGRPLRACPVWKPVFDEAYGGFGAVDADEMVRLRRRFDSRYLPLMAGGEAARTRLLRRLGPFPEAVSRLYHAMSAVTGSQVIVDSSKEPHYSFILRSCPSLDVFFLHLVRDPRAVAYSWQRQKKEAGLAGDEYMERRRPSVSACYFDVSNAAAEALWSSRPDRYMRVRYEDLLASPEDTLQSIGSFVGEDIDPRRVVVDGHARLRPTHSAWGNPNRFEHGMVSLERDDAWLSRLARRDRAVVTAMTFPLIRRYGYRLGRG